MKTSCEQRYLNFATDFGLITSTKNIIIIKWITLHRHYVRDIFVRRYYW